MPKRELNSDSQSCAMQRMGCRYFQDDANELCALVADVGGLVDFLDVDQLYLHLAFSPYLLSFESVDQALTFVRGLVEVEF